MKRLIEMYQINSPSREEDPIRNYVKKYLDREKIPYKVDEAGNVLISKGKGERVCILAHMDEVHHKKGVKARVVDGLICGTIKGKFAGIGADDKNGIYIAMKMLERYDNIKVALFVEEETGGHGSRMVDLSFFKDVKYCLQYDRRGGGDIITSISGTEICSDSFKAGILDVGIDFGFDATYGLFTDALNLVERGIGISCVNLSCGYYNPHMDTENTNIAELENAIAFGCSVIDTMTQKYPHTCKKWTAKAEKYPSNWVASRNPPIQSKGAPAWNERKTFIDQEEDDSNSRFPCNSCRTFDCHTCNKLKAYANYTSPF
jgi:putative aminopeptidase FrvX